MPVPNTGIYQVFPNTPLWTFDDGGNLVLAGNLFVGGTPDPSGSGTLLPGTEVVSTGNSALFYDPVLGPGLGTLLMSVSLAGGTDVYGNPYTAGVASYSTDANGNPLAITNAAGSFQFQTYLDGAWVTDASLSYTTASGLFVMSSPMTFSSPISIQDPSSASPLAESWHALPLTTAWTAVADYAAPAYKMTVEGDVRLAGRITGSDGTQNIATLATAYTPTLPLTAPLAVPSGTITADMTPRLKLTEAGILQPYGVTSTTTLSLDGIVFPLSAVPTPPPLPGAGLVGVSLIKFDGHGPGEIVDSSAAWDSMVVNGMGNNVMKRYYSAATPNGGPHGQPYGEFPSAGHDSQSCATIADAGIKLLISFKPLVDPDALYTSGLNVMACATALADLTAAVTYLTSIASNGIEFTLWQEFNYQMQTNFYANTDAQAGANYAAYVNFYAPAFQSPAQSEDQVLVVDFSGAATNQNAGWNSGSYLANISKCVFDCYALDYTKSGGPTSFPAALNHVLTIANDNDLPFGFWEFGVANGTATVPINQGQALAMGLPANSNFTYWCNTYILGTLQSRLNASLVNADTAWYVDDTVNTQNDPTYDSTGGVTACIKTVFDKCSSVT